MAAPLLQDLTPKARRTRQALIDAARVIVGRHGASAASVASICELANVGRTSFYNYFEDTNALLAVVAECSARDIEATFSARHLSKPRGLERLRECLEMLIGFADKDPETALLLAASSGPVREILVREIRAELDAVPELSGEDRDALTILTAASLVDAMQGIALRQLDGNTGARIVAALLRACKPDQGDAASLPAPAPKAR